MNNNYWIAVVFYSREKAPEDEFMRGTQKKQLITYLKSLYFGCVPQKYSHCEIVIGEWFQYPNQRVNPYDPNVSFIAYTVMRDSGAIRTERKFANNYKYDWVYLDIPQYKISEIAGACEALVATRVRFDFEGLVRSYIYPKGSLETGMWCTSFVTVILSQCYVIPRETNPAAITSDELFNLITTWCKLENTLLPANVIRDAVTNRIIGLP